MKRILELATVGAFLTLGATQTQAATTNYWVQNVNLALTAYVQLGGQIVQGTLPTKQFLAFLSGVTNTALRGSPIVVPATNFVGTNVTLEVTNLWFLPTNTPPDLPRSYTVTSDYVVTPDAGANYYTNNINFTNDLLITRTTATNTYRFQNAVTLTNGQSAYVFPDLPAYTVTAVWATNYGSDTVFDLSGTVYSNVVSTTTNYTHGTNVDFTKVSGAKLIYVTPMVGGTNLPSRFAVRYRSGSTNVDVDISSFLFESSGSPYLAVIQSMPYMARSFTEALSGLYFYNGTGTYLQFQGFDTQVWSAVLSRTNLLSPSILIQRKMTVFCGGAITAKIGTSTFNGSTTIGTGTITVSGGKLE